MPVMLRALLCNLTSRNRYFVIRTGPSNSMYTCAEVLVNHARACLTCTTWYHRMARPRSRVPYCVCDVTRPFVLHVREYTVHSAQYVISFVLQ